MATGLEARVLACVDRSPAADRVADHAAWAAKRLALPLELLHVLDRHPERASGEDHSGAIGFDARQQLLDELSNRDEAMSRAAREAGRIFLNRLRERTIAAGVPDTDIRQRHGSLEATLHELQRGASMFVLGRDTQSAQAGRAGLGGSLEAVLRALERPVLAVSDPFREPSRALLAFDGGTGARHGVEMIASSPLFAGLPVHLLMSGRIGHDRARQIETACATLRAAGIAASASLAPGDPQTAIHAAIAEHGIDLLVMGAYSHSPWRALIFGSRTTELLRTVRIPTLLLH